MFDGAPRYKQAVEFLTGETDVIPPGITLEEDRPEFMVLNRTYLAGGAGSTISAAGTIAQVALFNFTRDQIGIIQRIRFSSSANQSLFFSFFRGAQRPANFTPQGSVRLDTRTKIIAGSPATALEVDVNPLSAGPPAGTDGVTMDTLIVQAGVVYYEKDPIILAPGTGLIINTPVGVATLTVSYRWYERGTRSEELTQV